MEKGKLQKEGLSNWNTKNYGEVTEREARERNCKTACNRHVSGGKCERRGGRWGALSPQSSFTESHQMELKAPNEQEVERNWEQNFTAYRETSDHSHAIDSSPWPTYGVTICLSHCSFFVFLTKNTYLSDEIRATPVNAGRWHRCQKNLELYLKHTLRHTVCKSWCHSASNYGVLQRYWCDVVWTQIPIKRN